MMAFWSLASLMALAAFACVALAGRAPRQPEADRTRLNVSLYRERLAALEEQRREGTLDDAGFAALDEEARRELLMDAAPPARPDKTDKPGSQRQGARALLLGAALAPALALFVYADWGLGRGAMAHHDLAARIKATPADHPEFRGLIRQLAEQVDEMPYPNDARFLLVSALARHAAAVRQAAPSPEDQEARSPPLALPPGEARLSLTIPCCKAEE